MGKLVITSRLKSSWLPNAEHDLDKAVADMATQIDKRAKILAPVDTGALRGSGRVIHKGFGYYAVKFGGKRVPYARIQELGGWTGKNHATYIKPVHYLEQASDSVAEANIGRFVS